MDDPYLAAFRKIQAVAVTLVELLNEMNDEADRRDLRARIAPVQLVRVSDDERDCHEEFT
jgi:hypothetical protein